MAYDLRISLIQVLFILNDITATQCPGEVVREPADIVNDRVRILWRRGSRAGVEPPIQAYNGGDPNDLQNGIRNLNTCINALGNAVDDILPAYDDYDDCYFASFARQLLVSRNSLSFASALTIVHRAGMMVYYSSFIVSDDVARSRAEPDSAPTR